MVKKSPDYHLDSILAANPNRPPTNIANTPPIQNGDAVRMIPAESRPIPAKNRMPDAAPHNVTFAILYAVKNMVVHIFIFFRFLDWFYYFNRFSISNSSDNCKRDYTNLRNIRILRLSLVRDSLGGIRQVLE